VAISSKFQWLQVLDAVGSAVMAIVNMGIILWPELDERPLRADEGRHLVDRLPGQGLAKISLVLGRPTGVATWR
jgi:hypothetical protein